MCSGSGQNDTDLSGCGESLNTSGRAGHENDRQSRLIQRLYKYSSLHQSNGTINSATILMILISGLMAGPAVSL